MLSASPSSWLDAVPLTTRRLVLRQPTFADVPRLALYAGDFDVARMLVAVPHPYAEAHASAFIGDVLASNATGDSLALVVARLKEPHALVGLVSVTREGRGATMGWWFGRPYWGRGFATEAVGGMTGLAFRHPGIDSLAAGAFADNPASLRVQEKAGFVRTGESLRQSAARGGKVTQIDMILTRDAYAALSAQPRSAKGRA
ncbi:MAG: GNAT family N-acetyltransferase [Phreatobacter sp.]|uniref:GNAT family N-acetyltransferase n=1 Tax=Phreatobacter sp. TaxID=1966341 RepID=UPI004035AD25